MRYRHADRSARIPWRWYGAGVLAAVAVAYLSALVQVRGVAPVGLLSLSVGTVLGVIVGWLAGRLGVSCRARLVIGTAGIAIVAVIAQHAWLYQDFRRQWHEARTSSAEVALFRPETPWSPKEYFSREATHGRIAHWLVDAALILASATVAAVIAQRYAETSRIAASTAKSDPPTPDT